MRLSELHPEFMRWQDEQTEFWGIDFKEANGIMFLCPECTRRKQAGENIHVHSILCWNLSVPKTVYARHGRWDMVGTGIEDLSLVNGSSSVALQGGCNAHFWIKNGEIEFCNK